MAQKCKKSFCLLRLSKKLKKIEKKYKRNLKIFRRFFFHKTTFKYHMWIVPQITLEGSLDLKSKGGTHFTLEKWVCVCSTQNYLAIWLLRCDNYISYPSSHIFYYTVNKRPEAEFYVTQTINIVDSIEYIYCVPDRVHILCT